VTVDWSEALFHAVTCRAFFCQCGYQLPQAVALYGIAASTLRPYRSTRIDLAPQDEAKTGIPPDEKSERGKEGC